MSSSSTETGLVDIVMPQMGVSVSEGTLVAWHKQVGDEVAYEEPICEISTDKIDTEIPSSVAGTLVELVARIEDTVEVGAVLARVAPVGATAAPAGAETRPSEEAAAAAPAVVDGGGPEAGTAAGRDGRRRPGYSPVASRLAADLGVDLEQVEGTGRNGRVTKKDVIAFAERRDAAARPEPTLHGESPYVSEPPPVAFAAPAPSTPATPAPPGGGYVPPPAQPLSRMRSTIARHMKHSQESAATCTSWIEVDMTNVERFRRTLGLTAMPFIAEAATGALRDHPSLNAWLEGPDESLQHTIHEEVNLGIAVSLGKGGLIVPVIHRAQELSVTGLAARIRDLGSRGRAGQLSPDEMLGGTFTISNAGRVGGFISTPIINQPQVAILGVEGIAKRPVVVSAPDGADAIAIRSILVLGMTWDHRAMDGITANEFLAAVKQRLEAVAPKPTAAEEKR